MTERKIHQKGQRRHRKSEINLALFLFQTSYLGNYQDLSDVINSDKIKSDRRWLVLNARDAEGIPILINCLKGSSKKEDERDHLECIKILVSQQLPLDATDSSGKTVIHWAVLLDKIEICHFLLKKGAPANNLDNGKMSPIHIAISKRSEEFVEMLCEFGPVEILEAVDNMGRTPLCHALFISCANVFQKLLQCGANPNGETNHEKKLIAYCIENPTAKEFLNMLLQHNAKLFGKEANQFSSIHLAACQKDPASLSIISKYCTPVELNCIDRQGKTPLMFATYYGHIENVKILLREQVDTSILDDEGKSALHYTEKNSDSKCVDMLVAYDPSLLNKSSKTHKYPIHLAVMANNVTVLHAMLDNGAKPDLIDQDGHTLIHYATEYCALACLSELTSLGLSVNTPDKHGAFPIHYAARLEAEENMKKKYDLLKKLIEIGAQLNVMDGEGLQAIHWAVCMGNFEGLKLLLIQGADVNAKTKSQSYTDGR